MENRFITCLLGTAVGDAIGLPREGLSRRRAKRIFGGPPLRHALWFGYGTVSDDTEHACMTAAALIASAGEPDVFQRELAKRLRWWLVALPAGIGLATLKSILKLWLGFPSSRSGVRSAGNGPAMRAPILGLFATDDLELMSTLVRISTRMTHADPRAEQGAMVVALAAALGQRRAAEPISPQEFLALAEPYVGDADLLAKLRKACSFAAEQNSADDLAIELGLARRVSGFINHTVPIVIFAWLRYPGDFRTAMEATVALGGDTDTIGAILGGLLGSRGDSPPAEWLAGLSAQGRSPWVRRVLFSRSPNSLAWCQQLGEQLATVKVTGHRLTAAKRFAPAVFLRNLLFIGVVLLHGFRRLLPPY